MIIYPAIDLQDGKIVRLKQGRFDEVTHYDTDPLSAAQSWIAQGAAWLHVVDLDGAKTGVAANRDIIVDLVKNVTVPVQVGGGIRTADVIADYLQAGMARVILGTQAIGDAEFRQSVLKSHGPRIAVSLDCQNGMLTTKGWQEVTTISALDFAQRLEDEGAGLIIYTDIQRDGMLSGPNYEALEALLDTVTIPVIASGGIADIGDIRRLLALSGRGLNGAITGKALYEGTLNLKEAIALC